MKWIEFCTRRPVAISMLTFAVLLFGMVSQSRLELTLLPDLSYPTLTIRTELPGAAPEEVETLLSKPIEEAVGIIRNVRQVRSTSMAERSDVTLDFNWGTAMDFAVLDVREKLDALELPRQAQRPIVLRFDPSQDPVMRYGLALKVDQGGSAPVADEAALKRLRRIAEDLVQKPLEGVDGVAAVKIAGGLEDEVQVLVDLGKLAQFQLTLEQVEQRLAAENANISGGRVEQGASSYLVRTLNPFRTLDEMRETILVTRSDRPIYLRDVAEVRAGFKERESIIRVDGSEAVEISMFKEGDGNTVAIVDRIKSRVEALGKQLPADVEMRPLYDQSVFIRQAVDEVIYAAIEGGLLAILVLYLFLRNAWTTMIVAVAIPISVIATFNVMYGAGLSLNIMSLGGIALAIGMLVDDAIVVLESIHRQREHGLPLRDAAVSGTRRVAGAVTASTLTSVAVFFPMVFVEGIAGQLFADQALVVTCALNFSLIVSLTLIPMMASRAARVQPLAPAAPVVRERGRVREWLSRTRYAAFETLPALLLWPFVQVFRLAGLLLGAVLRPLAGIWQRGFAALERRYAALLGWALDHRLPVLAAAGALFVLALLTLSRIGVELIPPFNQGEFRAEIQMPPGTPLERTDALLQDVARQFSSSELARESVAASYTVAGTGNRLDANPQTGGENFGTYNVVIEPQAFAREEALRDALSRHLDVLPGVSYRYARPALFTLKTPLEVEIAGHDLAQLERISETLRRRLIASSRFTEVETTLKPGHPEIQVLFDQERAARLGLDTAVLAARVAAIVRGSVATRYRIGDREIDVLVRGAEDQRASIDDIRNLIVNPDSPQPIRLSSIAEVRLRSGPSEIRRVDQQRVIVVFANLAYGDLGEGIAEIESMLDDIALPSGLSARIAGQSEEMEVSFRSLTLALALAVFLVYLVMASQFESLLHPFVILFTIPLAGIGAIFALYLTGSVINVVALIGMIVLAGIVVKNGIVLIDLVNQLRAAGQALRPAMLEAGRMRLRPIVMTTLTTVLGLLPMALSGAEGAEVRQPMAITVIGGLLVSTLLTLVVIPVVYSLVQRDATPLAAAEPEPAP
ncbi:efflux RND transporter permease subunit [Sinimarinibacterium thermocellulolyticum]|uniref:Efflux RND transporter permease subunit n=1 Tax=Sinimarinibacterium thermocellulolyticum TaxID=3170016 RepID=A0ABV2AC51_9GAMM